MENFPVGQSKYLINSKKTENLVLGPGNTRTIFGGNILDSLKPVALSKSRKNCGKGILNCA
jgi:hypothetical protein